MTRKKLAFMIRLLAMLAVAHFGTLSSAGEQTGMADPPMPERWLPLDDQGWSVLTPAPDSRIIYVSTTDGDDATGVAYTADNPAVGADPAMPAGPVKPYKSLAAALEQARDSQPDWVLLKRGDRWRDATLTARNGRSASEPFVLGAYGEAEARPLLLGRTAQVRIGGPNSGVSYAAVLSLDLYASFIDPTSPDYGVNEHTEDRERNRIWAGMQISSGKRAPMVNVLVEDCRFRFCGLNCVNFGGVMEHVVFRRNLVLDRYPVHGHTMGMWGARASLLMEECVFDHNGWLLQNVPENRGRRGLANPLSHNTYCTGMRSTIFRDNLFLRAASIGNKWTANQGPGSARNIVIDNNLYVDGEIGISMGGNKPGPLRWQNMQITNNVMLDMGKSRPTGRVLGWYVDATDWDGGLIAGNLLLHQRSPDVRNVYAIHMGSIDAGEEGGEGGVHFRNVTICDNVVHGLQSTRPMIQIAGGERFENVVFARNKVQLPGLTQLLARVGSFHGVRFENNVYYSDHEAGQAFSAAGRQVDFRGWIGASGETGARFEHVNFSDPDRNIERYLRSLGKPPTQETFISEVRKQSKANWRPELTAAVINDWLRDGFRAK